MRTFESGAIRDDDADKFDYEGFISPAFLKEFGAYMYLHGRAKGVPSDNWQLGIPIDQYMKSLIRHTIDLWDAYRHEASGQDLLPILCAIFFNVQGIGYELLRHENPRHD